MALNIDNRFVTGVYALGQWFKVKPNTIDIDAYSFRAWEDIDPDPHDWEEGATDYEMGAAYPDPRPDGPHCGVYGGNSRRSWAIPTGNIGISFIEEKTGDRVSFCLLEVKAFRERRPDPR
jgi:hypothetical protein